MIINRVFYVKSGSKERVTDIRSFLVGKNKKIKSINVNLGQEIEIFHSDIKDDFGKEYNPYKGQKDLIIEIKDGDRIYELPPFKEYENSLRENQKRTIKIKIS